MSLKRDVCQHSVALKAGKRHSFYVFLFKLLYFGYKRMFASFWQNFRQKLANIPPGQNVGKHTPPSNLGGLGAEILKFGIILEMCFDEMFRIVSIEIRI